MIMIIIIIFTIYYFIPVMVLIITLSISCIQTHSCHRTRRWETHARSKNNSNPHWSPSNVCMHVNRTLTIYVIWGVTFIGLLYTEEAWWLNGLVTQHSVCSPQGNWVSVHWLRQMSTFSSGHVSYMIYLNIVIVQLKDFFSSTTVQLQVTLYI